MSIILIYGQLEYQRWKIFSNKSVSFRYKSNNSAKNVKFKNMC